MTIDLDVFSPAARKALDPGSPPALKLMASRGILPGAGPGDLLSVLALFSTEDDAALSSSAKKTLADLPPAVLDAELSVNLPAPVIDVLARRFVDSVSGVEKLLRMPRIGEPALVHLAEHASETTGERIATNETLLLRYPRVIEALYMNPRVRMSTADRVLELAVRNNLELNIPAFKEASQAILEELIPEPTEEETFDDRLFKEADQAAQAVELADSVEDDTHEADDEGKEKVREKFLPLYVAISQMTITQKIRRAMLGTNAERLLLVRDTNRLVAAAAASSPKLNENDAARIASSRNVIDDVLRILAQNRSLTQSHLVKLNLILNPKTPFTFSSRMIPHLRDNELRMLAKSKNVTANVQTAARQQLMRKQTKR